MFYHQNDALIIGDVLVECSFGNKAQISFIHSNYRTRLNNVAGDSEDPTGKVVHKIFGDWHENVFLWK
ncbi:unnamed protein product [Rotaria sp. Silwood1]|nr:unnamed protein product [Rotaria sp. Silwood1]CAF1640410.1 unnamed protein product [Rotaria sp. Silwood1]CAF3916525.1 unnamed protein product [Rotaria sp. Silwood1]